MTLKTQQRLDLIQKNITTQRLVEVGYPVFMDKTPVRSGNARRHTRRDSTSISADYAYAHRLDQGWSHQSPNGMVRPTVEAVRTYIKNILGR